MVLGLLLLLLGAAHAQTAADECQPIDGIHRHQPQYHIIVIARLVCMPSRSCMHCLQRPGALSRPVGNPSPLAVAARRARCSQVIAVPHGRVV